LEAFKRINAAYKAGLEPEFCQIQHMAEWTGEKRFVSTTGVKSTAVES
jgi:hypothetical protein